METTAKKNLMAVQEEKTEQNGVKEQDLTVAAASDHALASGSKELDQKKSA